jgi:hypothetical protein
MEAGTLLIRKINEMKVLPKECRKLEIGGYCIETAANIYGIGWTTAKNRASSDHGDVVESFY